jgi:hypothetical protein
VSDIEPVDRASEAGRPLSAALPDWGLAHESLAVLPWAEAFDRFAERAAMHDYWWPLVRGIGTREDFIVIEDTRGITSARLSLSARSVVEDIVMRPQRGDIGDADFIGTDGDMPA